MIKNVLETSHLVFLGGTERTSAVYNFEDQPEHSLTSRTSPAVPDILRTYSYNVAGQLASFPHKIGAQAPVTLASETYNDLGQLTAKTFPTIVSANQTYAYNIRPGLAENPWQRYDANGNLTQNKDKKISSISYNHLNLPDTVTYTGTLGKIVFGYDAEEDGASRISPFGLIQLRAG